MNAYLLCAFGVASSPGYHDLQAFLKRRLLSPMCIRSFDPNKLSLLFFVVQHHPGGFSLLAVEHWESYQGANQTDKAG